MKKNILNLALVLFSSSFFVACNTSQPETNQEEIPQEETQYNEVVEEIDTTSLVEEIDKKRADIEMLENEPIEVLTDSLREKIKQKWSAIHYYLDGEQIVKIKTYPHAEISNRTEEFYADNSNLVLVVIEDNGSGDKGKTKDLIDKMYYFNDGYFIYVLKSNKELDLNSSETEAKELMSEFQEYVKIYENYSN